MGGGIGMGNTCKPMAVSFQCMTKFTTKKKKMATKCKSSDAGSLDILLLCLIYRLNLVLSVCIYTHAHTHMKKHSVCRVGTVVFSGLL